MRKLNIFVTAENILYENSLINISKTKNCFFIKYNSFIFGAFIFVIKSQ